MANLPPLSEITILILSLTFDPSRKFPLPNALCASLVSLRQWVRLSQNFHLLGDLGQGVPDYVQHVFQCLIGQQVQGQIQQETEGWGVGI